MEDDKEDIIRNIIEGVSDMTAEELLKAVSDYKADKEFDKELDRLYEGDLD